jgi:hypothetical protein
MVAAGRGVVTWHAMKAALLIPLLAARVFAQPPATTFEDRPGYKLSNGTVELTVLQKGASLVSLVLAKDSTRINPLWNPAMLAREKNQPRRFGNSIGHFVCVDGFGGSSREERAAGFPGHGEAYSKEFATDAFMTEKGVTTLVMSSPLPLAQEKLTRTMRLVEGENVVYVHSKLESQTAFDRPIAWAEHATIGAPFLERGVTVVDLPAVRSKTRPHDGSALHRLVSDKEFTWPMAPLLAGGSVDIRTAPVGVDSGDHTTSSMNLSKSYAWVTALHPVKRLLIGWIFKSTDFPWIQNWEYYPKIETLARGLEFSTQPFDIPRREAVAMSGLFDTPTFRWLPAKSTIETGFAIFYTETPEGFKGVSDVRIENGTIVVEDSASQKRVTLKASLTI